MDAVMEYWQVFAIVVAALFVIVVLAMLWRRWQPRNRGNFTSLKAQCSGIMSALEQEREKNDALSESIEKKKPALEELKKRLNIDVREQDLAEDEASLAESSRSIMDLEKALKRIQRRMRKSGRYDSTHSADSQPGKRPLDMLEDSFDASDDFSHVDAYSQQQRHENSNDEEEVTAPIPVLNRPAQATSHGSTSYNAQDA